MLKNCLIISSLFLNTNILAQNNVNNTVPNCTPLKDLISSATTNFKSVTGKFRELKNNDSLFVAKLQLPGAINSVIQKRNAYIGTIYDSSSFEDFQARYNQVVGMIYDCLSPDDFEVTRIGKMGDPIMKTFPDIQFRSKEEGHDDHEHDGGAPAPVPGKVVKKPIVIYVGAACDQPSGKYKVQVLIHTI